MACLDTESKNKMILAMADALVGAKDEILRANEADVDSARGTISDVMIDRLLLTEERILSMADGMRKIAALPDPVGKDITTVKRPNGLLIISAALRSV